MKKIMPIFLACVLFVNTTLGSFASSPIINDTYPEILETVQFDTEDVSPQGGVVEFFIGWVAGKALDFLLSYVANSSYSRTVTRGGRKYVIIYDGNPWGIDPQTYQVHQR